MQLRKMMLVLTALGAMSGLMAGCDDPATAQGSCISNDECGESEICHPTAQVCVQTCNSGSDCPDTAKTCAPLGGTGANANTRICQCSTDVLCNGGTGSSSTDLVCSNLDNVCVTRCTSNSECTGTRTCNTGTGQCEEGDNEPEPGQSCSGEGRTTCGHGLICTNSVCSEPPAPTCQNYTQFPNKADLGTTGPIIYKVETVSAVVDQAFCPNAKRLRIRVSAYSSTAFPARSNDLNDFFYIFTDGRRQNATVSASSGNYTVSGTNNDQAQIVVSLCVAENSTTNSAGFYFKDGNFYCHQSNY
ncbi:hypothetical protein [Comamonas sp. JC664]|uniref:hypothetical protein n=1 Tax=Comamonas sp. JC664 TaxID=2801917 RepID=UPI00174CAD86|nr:hypothetical protein [Comamonas sp. JC664]MBL0697162.1 hypothetical protein [Comamonas sp. JC664]GHG82872.1 hypothetical protein GCM10012319_37320 [Comamonas sp. KCTC 72670]